MEKTIVIGDSLKGILENLKVYAKTEKPILLYGPTGSGKDHLAKFIHENSSRSHKELVEIDCTTLDTGIRQQSELFGHVKGAYTGATSTRGGRVEKGNNSAVFLNEISVLDNNSQAQLHHLFEKKEIKKVGADDYRPVNVRIIGASESKLKPSLERRFTHQESIPPLKDRKDDIPQLIKHFLKNTEIKFITIPCLIHLCDYDWPQNVGELERFLETLVELVRAGRPEGNYGPNIIGEELLETACPSLETFRRSMDLLLLHIDLGKIKEDSPHYDSYKFF